MTQKKQIDMARPKRIKIEPQKIGEFEVDGEKVDIVYVTEETESYGHGAAKRKAAFQNYNKALESIANQYYFGTTKQKARIKEYISKPISLSGLAIELGLAGIELEERAMRELAKNIKIAIKAFDEALKNKE